MSSTTTTMKSFFAFVRKEFYHIFRDPRTVLILIAMPIVQIIIFGFAISTELRQVNVAVYAPTYDNATVNLVNRFNTSEYFTVVKDLTRPEEIDQSMREGSADLVLIFPDRFYEQLLHTNTAPVQLMINACDPNKATLINTYSSNLIEQYSRELTIGKGVPQTVVIPEIKMLYNPEMNSSFNFVPGVMGLILLLIGAMMTSISIVREKERGTLEILLVSPMRPIWVIVAKIVPYFTLSIINIISILILSVTVLEVPIAGSVLGLFFISLLYILVSLSLGILISTIAQQQVTAMLISGMVLMMPILLLSGMMFPIEGMPDILQIISHIIPAKWYIQAVKKVMIMGLPVYEALQEIIILTVMTITILTISLKRFKQRL